MPHRERQKEGFAVGHPARGEGAKIIAIAAANNLPPPYLSKALRLPNAYQPCHLVGTEDRAAMFGRQRKRLQ